ncbi:hypothetical protein [Micromonospora profundi]|uniref:hypothetical protein n=1 Tax=Micromonospora profundi TaxID=1420889 RepID=UPI003658ED5F
MERSQDSRQPYDHGSGYQGSSRSTSDQGDDNAYTYTYEDSPALDMGSSSTGDYYLPSTYGVNPYPTEWAQSDQVDHLAALMQQQQLSDNFASVYEEAREAQDVFAMSPADYWASVPAPVTPPPPTFGELDEGTAAWQREDQEIADGLTDAVNGEGFQLGTHPVTGGEVVVPEGSPLASPSHTPSGSPPRPTSSAYSTGNVPGRADLEAGRTPSFRVAPDGGTLLQRTAAGLWAAVQDEEIRTRVGYAIGSTLEGIGRSAGVSYAIATGNAVVLGSDIYNRGQSIYNNLTTPPVDVPLLARDVADVVGLTTGIAAGYTIISGVDRQASSATQLVINRANIEAAGYLNAAGALANTAGAYLANVQRRREAANPTDAGSEHGSHETLNPPPSHRSHGTTSGAARMTAPYAPQEFDAYQQGESSNQSTLQHRGRGKGKGKGKASVRS